MSKKNFFDLIQHLPQKAKKIFNRIFKINKHYIVINNLSKINSNFSIFTNQTVTIVQDKIINQTTIFNSSRRKRHQPQNLKHSNKENIYDPFCNPLKETPEDEIGRLENKYAITASNLSKMAAFHSLVIFKKHNFDELNISYFQGGIELVNLWFKKITSLSNKQIKHKILIWNYNYRAGASILHPHLQVLAYKENIIKIINLQKKINDYKTKFRSSYFNDYFLIAKYLKISKKINKFMIWPSFTPLKDRGINFYGDIAEGTRILWKTIKKLTKNKNASFNLIYNYDLKFGTIVDRGNIEKKNSDIGALEIYQIPVVSQEPQEIANLII